MIEDQDIRRKTVLLVGEVLKIETMPAWYHSPSSCYSFVAVFYDRVEGGALRIWFTETRLVLPWFYLLALIPFHSTRLYSTPLDFTQINFIHKHKFDVYRFVYRSNRSTYPSTHQPTYFFNIAFQSIPIYPPAAAMQEDFPHVHLTYFSMAQVLLRCPFLPCPC